MNPIVFFYMLQKLDIFVPPVYKFYRAKNSLPYKSVSERIVPRTLNLLNL
jgi:hypothetical protein